MELWEDPKQIEQAVKDKIWEKYTEKQLSRVLDHYLSSSHFCYDVNFKKVLKRLSPEWFAGYSARVNKKKLIALAKNGNSKPKSEDSNGKRNKLTEAFYRYTRKREGEYDVNFVNTIRKINPSWLIRQKDTGAQNREQFLQMAKNGEPKPDKKQKHLIYSYFHLSRKGFFPTFETELRAVRPDWFLKGKSFEGNQAQQELLRRAINKESRPNYVTEKKLHSFLANYTCKTSKSYDEQFDIEIRKLAPQWFRSK